MWFCRDVADALDNLIETMGGMWVGLATSNRNTSPHNRLISEGRRLRATLLRALADEIDPDLDQKRLKQLPAVSRVDANGIPGPFAFYEAIDRVICAFAIEPDPATVERVADDWMEKLEGLVERGRLLGPAWLDAQMENDHGDR